MGGPDKPGHDKGEVCTPHVIPRFMRGTHAVMLQPASNRPAWVARMNRAMTKRERRDVYDKEKEKERDTKNPASSRQRGSSSQRSAQAYCMRSMATAVASPPPMQSEATPLFTPFFSMAEIRVTMMRAPDAPIG